MKKKDFFMSMLTMIMVAVLSFGLTSCSKDDPEPTPEPTPVPVVATSVTITNQSTLTLTRFRVVFLNASNEILTDKDYGTMYPNDYISAPIPTSATQYYMATYINSTWYFSVNYNISYTSLSITDAVVREWRSN